MSAKMNRIILHHSAGPHKVTAADRSHYHRIIDGDGNTWTGSHLISANAPGKSLASGQYAAHTRGLNTGSIGISMSCMKDANWSRPRDCAHFPTPAQIAAFIRDVADVSIEYSIPVTRKTILSHAEVEITLGVEQAGKWDFDYDLWQRIDSRDPVVIGDIIRDAVSAEIARLGGKPAPAAASPRRTLKRGHTGADVRELQTLLNAALGLDKPLAIDGQFGPETFSAVQLFQIERELLADGIVGRMTWTALLESAR